ncbi:MAG: hypothetical protein FRX48_00888 [Lasallia pustulata]|uniref:C2H2-type domain-containing protein n=1 Tax=Lasallia pustulata TaxID=136370 RepID=A0A5M8Q218_9LECA|nr:MAG: hypothetical protein FRX48_00888 [Lasallia pustulata]
MVLLEQMGSYGRPDIAKIGYEEPLQNDSDEEVVGRDVGGAAVENDLVQAAQDAERIIDETDRHPEDPVVSSRCHLSPLDLPICTTQDLNSTAEHPRGPEMVTVEEEKDNGSDTIIVASKATTAGEKSRNKINSPKTRRPSSSRGSVPKGRRNSDSLASSPVFIHAISVSQGSPMDSETLPAMKTSPQQNAVKSPNGQQSLPSLYDQLGPLPEFNPVKGEVANGTSTNGRGTFVSINGHSPPKTAQYPNLQTRNYHHPYPPTAPQPSSSTTSYSSNSPRDYRSGHDPMGSSHPGKPGPAYYSNGTTPQSDEQGPFSAESNPTTGSYSTEASANGDRMSVDAPRPITLPPLPAGPPLPLAHGFKCEYSGCTAAPFHTQYLLNSHANVHSQNRPHYCPEPDCSRSEGGKGFKRKNEMIRHGLVHKSPGYICPFCPEREHKYPRPDNLQRHVRVHHVDKHKDDPLLRDVLAQRPEGGSRGRRRRLGSS